MVVDLNVAIIDLNLVIIKLCIEKQKLTNVLMEGGFGINIIENHICKFIKLSMLKNYINYTLHGILGLGTLKYYRT